MSKEIDEDIFLLCQREPQTLFNEKFIHRLYHGYWYLKIWTYIGLLRIQILVSFFAMPISGVDHYTTCST